MNCTICGAELTADEAHIQAYTGSAICDDLAACGRNLVAAGAQERERQAYADAHRDMDEEMERELTEYGRAPVGITRWAWQSMIDAEDDRHYDYGDL